MLFGLAKRCLTSVDLKTLMRLGWVCGWSNMQAIRRFERGLKKGEVYPPFLFMSITNGCNLACQGCWVTPTRPVQHMDVALMDKIVSEGRERGCRFYGLLGGEPLLHPELMPFLSRHRDCVFQIFTNGVLLDRELASEFRRLGNVTPLISVEGLEQVSDERRGGTGVFERTMSGIENCRRGRLAFGIATSVCKTNKDDLATEAFARRIADAGALYLWYYLYRPVGPRPCPELALNHDEVLELRRFLVDIRTRVPLIIVDAYWDHEGRALCPAAVGVSHHINPFGDVEPCPIIQFAGDRLGDRAIAADLHGSEFLAAFREMTRTRTRGCILLEDPGALLTLLRERGARDTTGRNAGYTELEAMSPRPSHHTPGEEIPEKHWFYRFAKKHWFFGFGAYG